MTNYVQNEIEERVGRLQDADDYTPLSGVVDLVGRGAVWEKYVHTGVCVADMYLRAASLFTGATMDEVVSDLEDHYLDNERRAIIQKVKQEFLDATALDEEHEGQSVYECWLRNALAWSLCRSVASRTDLEPFSLDDAVDYPNKEAVRLSPWTMDDGVNGAEVIIPVFVDATMMNTNTSEDTE